jgi:hypothetical protein
VETSYGEQILASLSPWPLVSGARAYTATAAAPDATPGVGLVAVVVAVATVAIAAEFSR